MALLLVSNPSTTPPLSPAVLRSNIVEFVVNAVSFAQADTDIVDWLNTALSAILIYDEVPLKLPDPPSRAPLVTYDTLVLAPSMPLPIDDCPRLPELLNLYAACKRYGAEVGVGVGV